MKIISYNVNGLRAAIKKGFIDWLQTHPADVICLQEVKAAQTDIDLSPFAALGYSDHWFCANKKGYSGVTIFSKYQPTEVVCGTGHANSDFEGRVISLQFGKLRVVNAYFPSGTAGSDRQNFKYQWLDEFYIYLEGLKKENTHVVLCGDYNIAHKEIDIHNPAGNKNNSGFLPAERAWMDKLYTSGWLDAFRQLHPEPHRYTWWSQRFPSVRAQNKGWRLDYVSITESLRPFLTASEIYPDIKHSDHCPVYVAIDDAALS